LKKVGLETAGKIPVAKNFRRHLQRVGLAPGNPATIQAGILDEPMSGLDPVGAREVREHHLELDNAGKTILFSTHICPMRDVVRPGRRDRWRKFAVSARREQLSECRQPQWKFFFEVPASDDSRGNPFEGREVGGHLRVAVGEADCNGTPG